VRLGWRWGSVRVPGGLGLVCGQAVHDEVRNAACGRWVEIREHYDDVAGLRKDLQVAVHAGSAAAVAEVAQGGTWV